MPEKSKYRSWSIPRLLENKRKIEEALSEAMIKETNLDAKQFRSVHSLPECGDLEQVYAGEKLGTANVEGVQVRTTYYRVRCNTHNVMSSE